MQQKCTITHFALEAVFLIHTPLATRVNILLSDSLVLHLDQLMHPQLCLFLYQNLQLLCHHHLVAISFGGNLAFIPC